MGKLYSSMLVLAIGTAFGLAMAVFLSESFLSSRLGALLRSLRLAENRLWGNLPARIEDPLKITVELFAAIPSVVFSV